MVSRRTVTDNIKAPWAASCKPSWEAAAPVRFRVPGPAKSGRRRSPQGAAGLRILPGIILNDEVNRRADRRIELRLQGAGFEETCRLDDFDWSASITLDRRLLDAVFSLEFLDKHEHVLLVGPAGVGKSFMAPALGFTAIRDHRV